MKMLFFPRGGTCRMPLAIAFCSCFLGAASMARATGQPQNATELIGRANPVLQLPPSPGADANAPLSREPLTPAFPAPAAIAAPGAAPGKANEPDAVTPPQAVARMDAAPRGETLYETARRLRLSLPLPAPRIVVLKARRRLELWNGSTLVKTYRMALGDNPNGHKQRKYDGRTPEGEYYICTRNATTSNFHVFLGLSYPALHDAKRGIQSKAISWREYEIIRQSLASRATPLWTTQLGGWIGIHGGTNNIYAQRLIRKRGRTDWTAGCIALTDSEIEEIHAATRLGTPVSIKP